MCRYVGLFCRYVGLFIRTHPVHNWLYSNSVNCAVSCASFLDGYCSTVQGLLDWFEVDLGFTELLFIQIDLCVLCVFVLYSRVSLSSCPFLDILQSAVSCTSHFIGRGLWAQHSLAPQIATHKRCDPVSEWCRSAFCRNRAQMRRK